MWAAIDVDARELLAIEATWGRSACSALLFLRKVLEGCTNRPLFVVDRGSVVRLGVQVPGAELLPRGLRNQEQDERSFRTLKRRVFANNVNARRSTRAYIERDIVDLPVITIGSGTTSG